MNPPEIVCIKVQHLRQNGFISLENWKSESDAHIYIGRCVFYVKGASASKWKNPYSIKQYGLDKSLDMFEYWIRSNSCLFESLHELSNKVLGCWCENTSKCHGSILRKLYIEKYKF